MGMWVLPVLVILCIEASLCQDLRAFPDDERCKKNVNIGFVLDSSKSMSPSDYRLQKEFVKSLVSTFNISPGNSQAGAMVYSDDAVITARFDQFPYLEQFKQAVDDFYYMGKRTRIDKALKMASESFFTRKKGVRPENDNIMVILTDGLQTMDPDAVPLRDAVQPLHNNDIRVFAIGVGHHYNRTQLRDIVERDQDLYEAKNFNDLLKLVKKISRGTCAPAPVLQDGGWSSWQQWDTCVPDCGGGLQTRIRLCDNPPARNGGRPCTGEDRQTRACNQQPCEGKVRCTARVDIGFVMDASRSIGPRDFQKERDFVKGIAGAFEFSPKQAIAGVVSYSTEASLEIPLGQYMSAERFKFAVDQITKSDGQTRIDKALKLTSKDLFGRSRPGYPKVMIILTDGVQTTDPDAIPLDKASEPLHRAGVRVFAVGVGGQINKTELRLMVRRDEDVFTVNDFDDLLKETLRIAQRTCQLVAQKVDGEWSQWSQWDECTPECGGGSQMRQRSCSNPPPSNGGRLCFGSRSESRACNQQPCIGVIRQCSAKADIAFLMDASNSIGERDFQKQRDFVKGVANSYVFARDQAIAGAITYSTNAKVSIPLGKYMTVEDFKLAVDRIEYILGQTRIDKALKLAHTEIFSNKGGSRTGFPKILIILTDGRQTKDPDALALDKAVLPLREDGVKIFAVGVGPEVNGEELESMVESTDDVFTVNDFDDLLQKTNVIARRTCRRIEGPPAPPGNLVHSTWSQWQDWDKCIPECGGGQQTRRRVCKNDGDIRCPGRDSETRSCNQQPCVNIKCSARADLAFLMDGSGSIGTRDFQKERDFVKAVAGSFTFARDQTLASVIKYNQKATLEIPFGHHLTSRGFRLSVDQIPYTLGQTRIDKALDMAAKKIFSAEGGSRPGFPKILIIITDGVQTKDPDSIDLKEAVKPLQRAGVLILAVGIGGQTNPKQLSKMVLRSSDVYNVTDFDDLLNKAYVIAQRACNIIRRSRVDGGWSSWTGWTKCSLTCGRGIQSRKRACNNPLPANGGYVCRGSTEEKQYCNIRRCSEAIEGQWTSWSEWRPCSTSCGEGRQDRLRYCISPYSSNGRNCVGNSRESRLCSLGPCEVLPKDGRWTQWSVWQRCSSTCGGGKQYRWRSCTNPAPVNAGKYCDGRSQESRVCATNPCSVPKPDENCRGLDGEVLFILTSARNVGALNFRKQRTFVKTTAASYGVSPKGTTAGVISYDDNVKVHVNLGEYSDVYALSRAIDDIYYDSQGERRIDKALTVSSKTFFPPAGIVSYNVPRMIIIFINGRQTNDYDSIPLSRAVVPLQTAKVKIFAIAVGSSIDPRELQVLVGNNANVFRVLDFDDLLRRQNDFIRKTCSTFLPKPKPPCLGTTDLAFLLDSSGSIGAVNFEIQRKFVKAMSSSFNVGWLTTNVGVITYGSFGFVHFRFRDYHSLDKIRQALARIPYTVGQSRLDLGMNLAISDMFTTSGGARWDIPKVLVILTDGIQGETSKLNKASKKLRRAGVKVLVIGVGRVDPIKLRNLVGSDRDMVIVNKFEDLLSRSHELALRTCNGDDARGPFPPSPGPICRNNMDVAFALDSSWEIRQRNYKKQKQFVKEIASHIGFSQYGSRIGVLVYGDTSLIEVRLDHHTSASKFNRKINQIPYYSQRRRIDKALTTADLLYKFPAAGENTPGSKVLVLIAAGRRTITDDALPLWEAVNPLKSAGVKIIAIGVGNDSILKTQLTYLTEQRNVFMIPNYEVLLKQTRDFKRIICEAGAKELNKRRPG